MLQRLPKYRRLTIVALGLMLAACATYSGVKMTKTDYGIRIPHKTHVDGGMSCTDCHDIAEKATIKGHDTCTACHEIDLEKMDVEQCKKCHTKPDQVVATRPVLLSPEVKFNHEKHASANVECAKCHTDPDKGPLPAMDKMKFCMDCHGTVRKELNECSVCHTKITKATRPETRGGTRISHNAPLLWAKEHGRESRVSPDFCSTCHDGPSFCDDCHSTQEPTSHTVAWRRETHGIEATWDRAKCAVCHEEDMCIKCHKNTQPSSHRAGWGGVANRHCANCHYPPELTNCTVCHEEIKHKGAKPSPHALGVFPATCGRCHPGGNPYRAPHLVNSTVSCRTCH